MSKLYRVEVSMTFYALADTPEEAEGYADAAIDDAGVHGFSQNASLCADIRHMYDFEDGELVYHEGRGDIDVKQAFNMATGKDYDSERKREFDEMRERMAQRHKPTNENDERVENIG